MSPPLMPPKSVPLPKKDPRVSSSSLGLMMTGMIALLIVWQVYTHGKLYEADSYARSLSTTTSTSFRSTNLFTTTAVNGGGRKAAASPLTTVADSHHGSPPPPRDACHIEEHAEYHGRVVQYEGSKLKDTAGECCATCSSTPECNIWVWCAKKNGCGPSQRPFGECWLKNNTVEELYSKYIGTARSDIDWTAGAIISVEDEERETAKKREKDRKEKERVEGLKNNPDLPLVFMDVAVNGTAIGRIEAVLFVFESPLAAENMRRMCTGEVKHKNGEPYTLKGAAFYRIIDRFIDQTGVQGESTFGGAFKDDPGGLALKHDRPYILSLANGGPNTNTGHFSILVGPAPHLNGKYVVFGEVVSGYDVVEAINKLSREKPKHELYSQWAKITEVGQLRRGKEVPLPDHKP